MIRSSNISPLAPGSKKCSPPPYTWEMLFPSILTFVDFEAALAVSAVSKAWNKRITVDLLTSKAGKMLFSRSNFVDYTQLETSSVALYDAVRATGTLPANSPTCVRCIDYISSVVARWQVSYAIYELAVNVVIEYLRRWEGRVRASPARFEQALVSHHVLLGSAAILIASKLRDVKALKIQQILVGYTKSISPEDVLCAEDIVLHSLPNWVDTDQYVTYLVKLLPALQAHCSISAGKKADPSVVSFVETCAMKCFGAPVSGLVKAAAIALISHYVVNIYNSILVPCSHDTAVRLHGLLLMLLTGDRCVHARYGLQQPCTACFVVHTIFIYMEKELKLVSANGKLILATQKAHAMLLHNLRQKWNIIVKSLNAIPTNIDMMNKVRV